MSLRELFVKYVIYECDVISKTHYGTHFVLLKVYCEKYVNIYSHKVFALIKLSYNVCN